MNKTKSTAGAKALLTISFLAGILINSFIILDAGFLNKLIKPPHKTASIENPPYVDKLRTSIVLVVVKDCNQQKKLWNGTGFVVKEVGQARYIATNAHVIKPGVNCDGITVYDYKGIKHKALLEGISVTEGFQNDLAIIKIELVKDNELPALELLDSSTYESGHDGEKIFTIGYPVLGTASTANKSSISSEGQISQFDQDNNYFITTGLSLNQGNSGGPVFLVDQQKVLGIAVAKVNTKIAENIGMVIPINHLKNFFIEKTGIEI